MGLDVLHPHSALAMSGHLITDIVAVHGLRGDAIRTWTEPKSKKLWLQDFLPATIEGTRVMSFNYNADTVFGNTTATISDCAGALLGSLAARRENEDEMARPIVFVAHSLGGIVVKQALVLAKNEAKYGSISNHTKGIFFFATPHKGSDFANYGSVLAELATRLINKPTPQLLNALESNSKTLSDLTKQFIDLAPNFQIATFYELQPMSLSRNLIVTKESAILGVEGEAPLGVTADHVGICRFGSQGDDTYIKFIWRLRSMLPKENVTQSNREAPDPSQSAEPYNKFYEVPHNVSSIFTGRDDISGRLRAKCLPSELAIRQKEQKRFVLYGLGGIGKTQICLKFAQDHRESFWGIFFADVSSISTAEQSFSKLALSCQVGDNREAFQKWLASRTEHWLFVLDNADDLSVDLSPYFPIGARGTIIITTRNPQHELYKTVGGGSAQIDKMDSDEATALLLKASNADENDQSSRSGAQHVVQILGFIPLAIIHAGAAIRELYTHEEYCEAFTDRRKDLLESWNLPIGADYKYTVYATWEVSVNAIRKTAKGEAGVSKRDSVDAANALDLLNVFGFWYNEDISEEVLQEVWASVPNFDGDQWWNSHMIQLFRKDRTPKWDPLPFRKAINILSKYSLIYREGGRVSLHPLVQSCIQDLLDDKTQLQWWTKSLIMLAMAVRMKHEGSREANTRQMLLGPHLDTCLKIRDFGDFLVEDDSAGKRMRAILRLLIYDWRGEVLSDRLLLAQRAVEYGKKLLDENDRQLWLCLGASAVLAIDSGQWQTALLLLEAKVITYLNAHPPNSKYPIYFLVALEGLIRACIQGGKMQEALEISEKVLKTCKGLQDERVQILWLEEALVPIYLASGRKDYALDVAQTTYSKIEASIGEAGPGSVWSKYRLANVYNCTGHPQKTVEMCHQMMQWDILPEYHHITLDTQVLLARAYMNLGRPKDGIPLVVDALEKGEKNGEPEIYMREWRLGLEDMRAMEAEQLSQRPEPSAEIEEPGAHERLTTDQEQPSAATEIHHRSEKGHRSWLRNAIRRK